MRWEKVFLHIKEVESGDYDTIKILGVWDNAQKLMTYLNEQMMNMFDSIVKIRRANKQTFGKNETYHGLWEYVVEMKPNTPLDISNFELTCSNQDRKDGVKVYEIEEFFEENVYPGIWKPDPNFIESFNKEMNNLRANEYKTGSQKHKLIMFRDLFKELKENGIVEGEVFEIKRDY